MGTLGRRLSSLSHPHKQFQLLPIVASESQLVPCMKGIPSPTLGFLSFPVASKSCPRLIGVRRSFFERRWSAAEHDNLH